MTISAARLAAAASCAEAVSIRSTRPFISGDTSFPGSSFFVPTVSQSGSAFEHNSKRNAGGSFGDRSCSLRVGKACIRGCRSGGKLPRLRRGRGAEQSVVVATATCPHCRYATEIRSKLPATACISALGTMRSRSDGWKRAGARGALDQQQQRKQSFTRGAFADDDNQREASLMNKKKLDEIVPLPPLPATKLLTLPTILTLARVAAVPAILAVFYCKETWATAAGAAIFILAAVTDWLDGYLARKMGSSSAFGAFLDPVADKLMVAAALVLLCTRPLPISEFATTPWLLPLPTIAIIGREITMSAVREWAASQGGDVRKAVAVNNLGKIKTASQMIAITLLLATGDGGLDSKIAGILGVALLYVAAVLALWSLAMYMKGIWGSLNK